MINCSHLKACSHGPTIHNTPPLHKHPAQGVSQKPWRAQSVSQCPPSIIFPPSVLCLMFITSAWNVLPRLFCAAKSYPPFTVLLESHLFHRAFLTGPAHRTSLLSGLQSWGCPFWGPIPSHFPFFPLPYSSGCDKLQSVWANLSPLPVFIRPSG